MRRWLHLAGIGLLGILALKTLQLTLTTLAIVAAALLLASGA